MKNEKKRTKKTTNKELAKRYNVSDKTISRYKKNGQLADFIVKQDTILMKQEVSVQVQKILNDDELKAGIARGALETLKSLANEYKLTPDEIASLDPSIKVQASLKAMEIVLKYGSD